MNTTEAVLLALFIVAIMYVIYYLTKDIDWSKINLDYMKANYIESPWTVYGRSTGDYDEAAVLAMERATARNSPSPGDHILAATIITRNILAQEHRPIRENNGVPTNAARAQSQQRRILFDTARSHYIEALRPAPVIRRRDEQKTTEFIIDAAIGFAVNGWHDLIANDPIIRENIYEFTIPHNTFDDILFDIASNRHTNNIQDRKNTASLNAVTKMDEVATYVELATQNTDDPQNSHDSSVLACLKSIIDRLKLDQGDEKIPTPDEILAEISANINEFSEGRAYKLNDIKSVIERIKLGERVISVGATDTECLGRVWLRSSDPKNITMSKKIQQAVFDALYDSLEDGMAGRKIVCVNGRTSRILSSLILLDWDERNWEVKKLEQFKNDIFAQTAETIQSVAMTAVASSDPEMQKAGKAYLAQTAEEIDEIGDVDDTVSDKLANQMRDAIDLMIKKYMQDLETKMGIKNAISPYIVEMVSTEAKAAVA